MYYKIPNLRQKQNFRVIFLAMDTSWPLCERLIDLKSETDIRLILANSKRFQSMRFQHLWARMLTMTGLDWTGLDWTRRVWTLKLILKRTGLQNRGKWIWLDIVSLFWTGEAKQITTNKRRKTRKGFISSAIPLVLLSFTLDSSQYAN